MAKKGIDVLIVSNPANVFYLSGFKCLASERIQTLTDPEAFLLIENKGSNSKDLILTDPRNAKTAKNIENFTFKPLPYPTNAQNLSCLIKDLVLRSDNLAFEEDSFTYLDLKSLKSQLRAKSIDASGMIGELRTIKDESELRKLKKAADITSNGYNYALSKLKPGITEKQLASEISKYFLEYADGNSFEPIVAFGKNSAVPHYETGDQKIKEGGILLIDLGAKIDGYCGDMTRTVYIGKAPSKFRRLYNLVLEAQNKCIGHLETNMVGKRVDSFVRDSFPDELKKYFMHGTGHGIGINVHEPPSLNKMSGENLKNGMVFSVEPGLYIESFGGIRIEDIVTLKNDEVLNLTETPKDLREIGLSN